ncbi:hypothetical protein RHMOL_Rhmol07G0150800 [Rhododendron molle]|uniref:Uncharacterized protein n=1 Tax=Rhododendron molle TaxID=49168 RepID=A0ACC0N272_RHOML|nr:hypothetical protein RHMOL_Rhmol07G0150800 [Rhododendron molle]
MHRWMRRRKPWPQVKAPTMERAPDSVRCGKWDLRPTKIRRNRETQKSDINLERRLFRDTKIIHISPRHFTKKETTDNSYEQEETTRFSTSSANSVVGENNVQALCLLTSYIS